MDYKELIEQQEKEREKLYFDRHTDYSYWGKLAFENPDHAGYEQEKQNVMKSYGEREKNMMSEHAKAREAYLTVNEQKKPEQRDIDELSDEFERLRKKGQKKEIEHSRER